MKRGTETLGPGSPMQRARGLWLGFGMLLASADVALAQNDIYAKSGEILTKLLVVALVLESAFATIFDWRVFRAYLSGRGVRTIVMVVASWLVVSAFNFDQVDQLFKLYAPSAKVSEGSLVSSLLTALVLAGGSAGIYRLLRNFGFRSAAPEDTPRPPKDKAWVAVRVKRSNAVGQILVRIGEVQENPHEMLPIAGTVGGGRPGLSDLLLRSPNRFPPNGGHTVEAGKVYQIVVEGKDGNGNPLTGLKGTYVFAQGAIVDYDVTL